MRAAADPATLSRVIEHFALLNIVPETVKARRFNGGALVIDLKVKGLAGDRIDIIARKLRAMVLVHGVAVEVFAAGCDLDDYRAARVSAEAALTA
ncbi:MAG: hypothetical protein D6763_03820 [Alphaproteobacteria bacterium]|nr:MAG: hypothetical protein D6763_03820 [Alphaproteobacteria bacterium]